MNLRKLIGLGGFRPEMKTTFEERKGESLNEGKNASENEVQKPYRKMVGFMHKLLFNIKSHYRLPSPEKNGIGVVGEDNFLPPPTHFIWQLFWITMFLLGYGLARLMSNP